MKTDGLHVAIVGATGAVGENMLKMLEESRLPISKLSLLSSKRSAGKKVMFKKEELTVQEATPESFEGVQLALFSAGGSVSQQLAPEAVKRGAVVVDNTSAFRMDTNTPLVVPEVNETDMLGHNGIIANPNCSTIQMVVALKPIQDAFGLKKVIVSTYQAVSGAGAKAVDEMYNQTKQMLHGEEVIPEILPVKADQKHYPIAFNAIPQIDKFQDNGFTFEEMKMINETRKIMHRDDLEVAATCVRLPIEAGHAESVYIEIEKDGVTADDIKEILSNAPGIVLQDDPSQQIYPMPLEAAGKRDVFVGRIRKDLDNDHGVHLWIVSDNLLKGAAWNSVQIAERMYELGLLTK